MLKNLLENWKSTAANFLTLVIIFAGYLAMQTPQTLAQLGISAKFAAWVMFVSGIAKLYVALITKDAK